MLAPERERVSGELIEGSVHRGRFKNTAELADAQLGALRTNRVVHDALDQRRRTCDIA
jgi:hypothetical protein